MRAVRIETSPFQILSLVEFESILKKNQHGCAKISGYISAEEKNRLDLRNFRRGCTSQSKRMLCAGMERRRDTACLYAGCTAIYVTSVLLSCYTHDIQMY